MTSERRATILSIAAWIAVGLVCFPLSVELSFVLIPNDFDIYLAAASKLQGGQSPYEAPITFHVSKTTTTDFFYLYPPLLASTLRALLWLAPTDARVVWAVLATVGVFATALVGVGARLWTRAQAPVAALALFFLPCTLDGITTGQVDALILLTLSVLLAALATGRHAYAGAALAAAMHIKATPVLLCIPLMRSDGRKALSWTLFFATLGAITVVALHGPSAWADFSKAASFVTSGERSWETAANRTPAKILVSLWGPSLTPKTSILLLQAVTLLLFAALTLRLVKRPQLPIVHGVCVGIVLMTFASPILWYHHLLWLSFPVVVAWKSSPHLARRLSILGLSVTLISTIWLDATLDPSQPGQIGVAAAWSLVTVCSGALLSYYLLLITPQTPPS